MKAKDLIVIEFGAMSSKYSVEAKDKLTAYAAIILFCGRNAALFAIYRPEECRKDSWLFAPNLQERLDEIFGGDGFFAYIDQHTEEIKAACKTIKKLI